VEADVADEHGLAEYRRLGTHGRVHAENGAFDVFVERVTSGTR
jgi:hypothetical protein